MCLDERRTRHSPEPCPARRVRRPEPHDVRPLGVSPLGRHDVHAVQGHAQPVAREQLPDVRPERTEALCGCREVVGVVEGHDAEGEVEAASGDDNRAVEPGDGGRRSEEGVSERGDGVPERGDVALCEMRQERAGRDRQDTLTRGIARTARGVREEHGRRQGCRTYSV